MNMAHKVFKKNFLSTANYVLHLVGKLSNYLDNKNSYHFKSWHKTEKWRTEITYQTRDREVNGKCKRGYFMTSFCKNFDG